MVKKLLDKGNYDILEFKLDVDYRGRSVIRMIGVGRSQETDIEFEISIRPSVIHGWPVIKDIPEKIKPLIDNPAITLCPLCYPENKNPLFLVKEKKGFAFCKVHGEIQWPVVEKPVKRGPGRPPATDKDE